MAAYLQLDDVNSLKAKIDDKAHDLFRAKTGVAPLQVSRYFKTKVGRGKEANCFLKNQDVWDNKEVRSLRGNLDSSQFFFIRQDRSWTTLNISRDLFEDLLSQYGVFPPFWKCAFTFGRKSEENEFEFPGFRARRTPRSSSNSEEINESAYMLRRVERNHRANSNGESPWSIRQTAVYNRITAKPSDDAAAGKSKSMFLFVAPSPNVEQQLSHCLEQSLSSEGAISPWNVQRILVADSMRNWMEYMAYLEEQLREQSDQIVLAKVGTDKENLSPLTDFNINFVDRQTLKILEDSVVDVQVILSTMCNTITRIRDNCIRSCEKLLIKYEREQMELILDEFDEHVREAEMYVNRAKMLRDRAESTANLLSDLLSYEEAIALKDLTKETQLESKNMYQLTKRSTKDAAAVKILTVITLIYLPFTIVANFFSTQFVQTNDGKLNVAHNAWLLAAVAVPLTVVTIGLWACWVYFTKVVPPPVSEHPNTLPSILRRRQSSFKSMLSSRRKTTIPGTPKSQNSSNFSSFKSIFLLKKKQRAGDIECGVRIVTPDEEKDEKHPPDTPPPTFTGPQQTWSSTASTMKS